MLRLRRRKKRELKQFRMKYEAAIIKMAREGYGRIRKESLEELSGDSALTQACLRKMGARLEEDYYFFPKICAEFDKKKGPK